MFEVISLTRVYRIIISDEKLYLGVNFGGQTSCAKIALFGQEGGWAAAVQKIGWTDLAAMTGTTREKVQRATRKKLS